MAGPWPGGRPRARPRRRRWRLACWMRPRRRSATPSPGPTSSCSLPRPPPVWRSWTGWRDPSARRSRPAPSSPTSRARRRALSPGPTRPACGSSGAIRWPAARRADSQAADADLFRDRPWVVVPGALADEDDVGAGGCARPGVRSPAAADGCRDARRRGGGDQPPPARPGGRARGGGRGRTRGGRAGRLAGRVAAWRPRAGATRRGSPGGTPPWAPGSRRRTPGPLADGLRAVRARLDAWIALLEASGAADMPDEAALRARLAAARARLRESP